MPTDHLGIIAVSAAIVFFIALFKGSKKFDSIIGV